MKKYGLFTLLTLLVLITACSKENAEETNESQVLKINMGIHCGWGLRLDSLTIMSNQAHLIQNFRSDPFSVFISVDSVKSLSNSQVNDLVAALDWNYFQSLNYNSGTVSSDGCDIWLKIEQGGQKHAIRFSPADTIPQLRKLSDQLDSIWVNMGYSPDDLLKNF
jgi:hypothetical protein